MSDNIESTNILNFEAKKKKKKPPPVLSMDESAAPAPTDTLDFGVKKKKKPKTVVDEEEIADKVVARKAESSSTTTDAKSKDETVDDLASKLNDELYFESKKKKKKIKRAADVADLEAEVSGAVASTADTADRTSGKESSSCDLPGFSYDQLLNRVFQQIQALNPELAADQKRRLVMVPPQMARVGTKKSVFVNFALICRTLGRDQHHLTQYILSELGTQGSIDANGSLLIRGRYMTKHMEPVLINYCRQYVLCTTCNSADTELSKDSRLLFVHCRRCGSRTTVKNVTSGFQAVTGKRAAMRAKTQ